ncbi:MAG: hypothetical protein HOP19_03380, partial [Acidobacteria bacterium]|nr:hypothetical protein [Acidobacteriota bacterium]
MFHHSFRIPRIVAIALLASLFALTAQLPTSYAAPQKASKEQEKPDKEKAKAEKEAEKEKEKADKES